MGRDTKHNREHGKCACVCVSVCLSLCVYGEIWQETLVRMSVVLVDYCLHQHVEIDVPGDNSASRICAAQVGRG